MTFYSEFVLAIVEKNDAPTVQKIITEETKHEQELLARRGWTLNAA